VRAWRRMLPKESELGKLSARHEIARWHDKTAKGYDTFRQMVELHYPTAENLEQWSYYSQLNQRDALRNGVEHFRRSKFCRGALLWQFNDCWPVQSWSLIDSCGGRKAAAYEVRRLFAPLLLSLEVLDETVRLWAILDNSVHSVDAQAMLVAHDLHDGSELRRWQAPVSLQPDQRRVVLEVDVRDFESTRTLLVAGLLDSKTFRLLTEPRHAEPRLPSIDVEWRANALHLRSNLPVVDLQIWDEDGTVDWIDNFCTLATAGAAQLRAIGRSNRLRARCLAGEVPIGI
jgi:beta-mannosidase